MSESIFNDEPIVEVTPKLVATLIERAKNSSNGSCRFCLHESIDHPVQEMVIAILSSTYRRPHRHPDGRCESCTVIDGEVRIIVFDDDGNVARKIDLSPPAAGKAFLYRISESVWHMPISLTPTAVYHEVSQGPHDKDSSIEYAPWSPVGEDKAEVNRFLSKLKAD